MLSSLSTRCMKHIAQVSIHSSHRLQQSHHTTSRTSQVLLFNALNHSKYQKHQYKQCHSITTNATNTTLDVQEIQTSTDIKEKKYIKNKKNKMQRNVTPHPNALPIDQVLSHLQLMEHWNCSGCGISLQYKDIKQLGYVPPQILEHRITHVKDLKKIKCERCYQMSHYGKLVDAKLPYHEYELRVKELRSKDLVMVQIVDLLDISGSLLRNVRYLFGNKPILLVVNKGDLIPSASGTRRLIRRIQNEAKAAGIENILSIYLVSAMKSIGMKEFIADVKKYRNGRDLCVVGAANVGKSTFLNAFMSFLVDRKWQHNHRRYMKLPEISLSEDLVDEDESIALLNSDDSILQEYNDANKAETLPEGGDDLEKNEIFYADDEDPNMILESEDETRHMTTSPLPGTTLAVQYLPVMVKNEVFNILDTPGLITDVQRQRLVEILAQDTSTNLKTVFPTASLPVTTYCIEPGRTLFLGGLARIDYESLNPLSSKSLNQLLLTWYGVLPGHLTKLESAEDTYIKHAGGLLSPPRGLDAVSTVGPLERRMSLQLKDYINADVKKKSKDAKKPKRTSFLELEMPSFGWLSITAVALDGTATSLQTIEEGTLTLSACKGFKITPRTPLFPYELSKSKSRLWKK